MLADSPTLTYCRTTLLPIWERWTNGNLTLRQALEGATADPATVGAHCDQLGASIVALQEVGDDTAGTGAAIQAGCAVLLVLTTEPDDVDDAWQHLCATAEALHRQALAAVQPPA